MPSYVKEETPRFPSAYPTQEDWQKWLFEKSPVRTGPLHDPDIRAAWTEFGFLHPDGYVTNIALRYLDDIEARGEAPYMPQPGRTAMRLYSEGYRLTNQGWTKENEPA